METEASTTEAVSAEPSTQVAVLKKEEDDEWEDCENKENLYTLIWKEDNIVELNDKLNFKLVDFGNACWVK